MAEGWVTQLYWGGSTARPVLVSGLWFATWMFFIRLDDTSSIPGTVVGAVLAGLIVGAWRAWDQAGRWPTGQELDPAERSEVVRLVIRGEGPADGRLAPAVIEFAQIQHNAAEFNRRYAWLLLGVLPALAGGWAWFETVDGQAISAVYLWVITVLLVVAGIRRRTVSTRARSSAERSEAAAQALLPTPHLDALP